MRTLRALAEQVAIATSVDEVCKFAADTLSSNQHDLPFTLLYLLDREGSKARLAGLSVVTKVDGVAQQVVDLDDDQTHWPFRKLVETGGVVEVNDLRTKFGELPGGAWPESPKRALVLPMAKPGQTQPVGFLVVGLSPRLVFNDDYRS